MLSSLSDAKISHIQESTTRAALTVLVKQIPLPVTLPSSPFPVVGPIPTFTACKQRTERGPPQVSGRWQIPQKVPHRQPEAAQHPKPRRRGQPGAVKKLWPPFAAAAPALPCPYFISFPRNSSFSSSSSSSSLHDQRRHFPSYSPPFFFLLLQTSQLLFFGTFFSLDWTSFLLIFSTLFSISHLAVNDTQVSPITGLWRLLLKSPLPQSHYLLLSFFPSRPPSRVSMTTTLPSQAATRTIWREYFFSQQKRR